MNVHHVSTQGCGCICQSKYGVECKDGKVQWQLLNFNEMIETSNIVNQRINDKEVNSTPMGSLMSMPMIALNNNLYRAMMNEESPIQTQSTFGDFSDHLGGLSSRSSRRLIFKAKDKTKEQSLEMKA